MDESRTSGDAVLGSEAEDAFSLLSDETRLAILRTLFAADEPLTFSRLREAVGVRDSGQFNYHLGRLTDRFVAQTDAGYELLVPGELVLGAVIAGSYEHPDVSIDPIPVEGSCPECRGDLEATYEEMQLQIVCVDCEMYVLAYPAPPGILHDRERADLPAVFSRYARSVMDQITGGVCPLCYGATDPDLDSVTGEGPPGLDYHCGRCESEFSLTVGITLVDHPEVQAFAREMGLDPATAPLWDLDALLMADQRRIDDGTDADAAVEVDVIIDGETLLVRLDPDLAVVETVRT